MARYISPAATGLSTQLASCSSPLLSPPSRRRSSSPPRRRTQRWQLEVPCWWKLTDRLQIRLPLTSPSSSAYSLAAPTATATPWRPTTPASSTTGPSRPSLPRATPTSRTTTPSGSRKVRQRARPSFRSRISSTPGLPTNPRWRRYTRSFGSHPRAPPNGRKVTVNIRLNELPIFGYYSITVTSNPNHHNI